MKKLFSISAILILSFFLSAQVPFTRGVNLTSWFQAGSARQIQFTRYTKQDFVNIKSLGCDVIRLPINLHSMTQGSPDYTIDPLFFEFLDQVVNWAEELQVYLILDNHSFDPSVNTDPNIGTILNKVWDQMARHYTNRSAYVLYEILNEPHGISAQSWGQIQQEVINTIRSVDTRHTLIVGGTNFNSYNDLSTVPRYTDNNLIYTFHFYDPFMFTHQGATWVTPSMAPLAGVPFPYDASRMPACPASLKGSWIESSLNNYSLDGTEAKVKSLIDIAVNFRNSTGAKIFCGEFGVYIPNSPNADRIYWYETVRKYLESKGIPWTTWDYQGGFGLFKKGSNQLFDYDINTDLVQKLGLIVPPQKVFSIVPTTTGFPIYSDYIENTIFEASNTAGTLDFYNSLQPNNGKYCIYWSGANQYNSVGFFFNPYKDLSQLVSNNYALDLMVRGKTPGTRFVARFMDTKTDANDHPWRMDYSIDDQQVPMDSKWHHVRIPLKSFTDAGSWDNNQWYSSENKFDWKAVEHFEIVSEQMALTGRDLWFDNIHVTNLDTAIVRNNSVLGIDHPERTAALNLEIYPNPVCREATINYRLIRPGQVDITMFSIHGQIVNKLVSQLQSPGLHTYTWGCDFRNKKRVPDGIYFCRFTSEEYSQSYKIIVNKCG